MEGEHAKMLQIQANGTRKEKKPTWSKKLKTILHPFICICFLWHLEQASGLKSPGRWWESCESSTPHDMCWAGWLRGIVHARDRWPTGHPGHSVIARMCNKKQWEDSEKTNKGWPMSIMFACTLNTRFAGGDSNIPSLAINTGGLV